MSTVEMPGGPEESGWGLCEGLVGSPHTGPVTQLTRARGSGEGVASCTNFHVHLGGLHNLLVDHKVRELLEEHRTGVDEDRVVEEGRLQERW